MNIFKLFLITFTSLSIFILLSGFQCSSPQMTSAKIAIKNNDLIGAENSLKEEVQKNPKNAEAWYLLGDVRRKLNNYEGMVQAFDQSLAISNEYSKIIKDTKLFVWQTSINNAVDLFNKSINTTKDTATLLRQYAIKNYQNAILVLPDSTLAYENMAIAYKAEGDIDGEIYCYKQYIERKKDPAIMINLINAYLRKAEIAKNSGDKEGNTSNLNNAILTINEARKIEPNNLDLLGILINVYIEADKTREAIPLMREFLQKEPKNKVFKNNLGLLLMQDNQLDEAIQLFEDALAIDNTYEEALRNGAVAYMKLGEKMKEESINQTDPNSKEEIDKSYQEKFKKAVTLLEKLIELKPNDAGLWDALATAYGNSGMFKKAEEAVKKADTIRKQNQK